MVQENRLLDRVIISSFSRLAVRRVKRLDPRIPVGFLYGPVRDRFLLKSGHDTLHQCEALHPHYTMVDKEYMRWARGQGFRVHVWTADDPAEMERMVRCDVDIIIITSRTCCGGFWGTPVARTAANPVQS
jgi:glycerophosphoryl diester phosphodiesterase